MGTFRFVLAIMVALSHAAVSIAGHNIGVVAVISFLLLSGFVMTALVTRHYGGQGDVGRFYLDRLARIYPQYGLYAGLALVAALALGPQRMGVTDLSVMNLVANLTIIPLDFYWLGGIGNGLLLAPAWSLGLEMTFYLVIPWLLIHRLRGVAFAGSLAFFSAALGGWIDSDVWGYRMLPGTLFIFLAGSYLWQAKANARLLVCMWVGCGAAAIVIAVLPVERPRILEVLLGIVVGVPLVAVLSTVRPGKLDEALGNVSYGLFLNHFPLFFVAKALGFSMTSAGSLIAWLAVCSGLAWATYIVVERPVLVWRRKLRLAAPETRGDTVAPRPEGPSCPQPSKTA